MYFGLKEEKHIKKLSTAKDSDIDTYCKKNKLSKKEKETLKAAVGLTRKVDSKFLISRIDHKSGSNVTDALPAIKLSNSEMEVLKAGYRCQCPACLSLRVVDGLAYVNGFVMGFIFGN
jgi:hypothetical protein